METRIGNIFVSIIRKVNKKTIFKNSKKIEINRKMISLLFAGTFITSA